MRLELVSAKALRDAMTAAHVSVRGLAATVGVSSSLIAHLRSDARTRTASLDLAQRITTALDVDAEQLWQIPQELRQLLDAS